MHNFRRILRTIWYMMPLLVAFIVLLYFQKTYDNYISSTAEQRYKDKVELTRNIVNQMNEIIVHDKTVNDSVANIVFKKFIVNFVNDIDSEEGVYARVLDTDGNLISLPSCMKSVVAFAESPNFKESDYFCSMKKRNEGSFSILTEQNTRLQIHWFSYPKHNSIYYIIVGVEYESIVPQLALNQFTFGLVIMLILMLIWTFYNLFLMITNNRLRKEVNTLRKITE